MHEGSPPPPEHLLQLKSELIERWKHLPPEHRASMALVLLQDVLAGNYGPWVMEALLLQEVAIQETLDTVLFDDQTAQPEGELFDWEILKCLPLPFTAEGEKDSALAYVKLVLPGDSRVWYVSAFDRQDMCFGLIVETEIRFDYFSLSELHTLPGTDGQGIRRDRSYAPKSLGELQALYEQRLKR